MDEVEFINFLAGIYLGLTQAEREAVARFAFSISVQRCPRHEPDLLSESRQNFEAYHQALCQKCVLGGN